MSHSGDFGPIFKNESLSPITLVLDLGGQACSSQSDGVLYATVRPSIIIHVSDFGLRRAKDIKKKPRVG
jgi:hypothetical protein